MLREPMRAPAFQTETAPVPGVSGASALRVRGRVRHLEATPLRRVLLDWIGSAEEPRLVIELGQVEDMDTSGAAVLVEALLAGRERGKRVLLCSPSESVLRLFRLAGFEDALRACCPTVAEARLRLSE